MAILRVEGLKRAYGERIVGPASFTLEAGEMGFVVGDSGSGKSTILDLIYGTRTATAGAAILEVGGWRGDLLSLSVPELVAVRRAAIGYCTQFLPAIPGKSGMDLGCEAATSADVAGVFERLALPPQIWELPASAWSGGERQRLNIALAALRKPALVLLDEPFASLDPGLHPAVWGLLSDLAEAGSSLIVGLHRLRGDTVLGRTLIRLDQPATNR